MCVRGTACRESIQFHKSSHTCSGRQSQISLAVEVGVVEVEEVEVERSSKRGRLMLLLPMAPARDQNVK